MDKQKGKDLNMLRALCSTEGEAEEALDFVIRYPATVQDVKHYMMALGEIPNNNVGKLLSEGYKISQLIEELISLQFPLCKRLIKIQNDFIKSIKIDQRSSKMEIKKTEFEVTKRVKCPYCGHKNTCFFSKDGGIPETILCDNTEGGCDEWFVLSYHYNIKITPKVSKIQEADPSLKGCPHLENYTNKKDTFGHLDHIESALLVLDRMFKIETKVKNREAAEKPLNSIAELLVNMREDLKKGE